MKKQYKPTPPSTLTQVSQTPNYQFKLPVRRTTNAFIMIVQRTIDQLIEKNKLGDFPIFKRFSTNKKIRLIYLLAEKEAKRIKSLRRKREVTPTDCEDLMKDAFYKSTLLHNLRQMEIVNGHSYKELQRQLLSKASNFVKIVASPPGKSK